MNQKPLHFKVRVVVEGCCDVRPVFEFDVGGQAKTKQAEHDDNCRCGRSIETVREECEVFLVGGASVCYMVSLN